MYYLIKFIIADANIVSMFHISYHIYSGFSQTFLHQHLQLFVMQRQTLLSCYLLVIIDLLRPITDTHESSHMLANHGMHLLD